MCAALGWLPNKPKSVGFFFKFNLLAKPNTTLLTTMGVFQTGPYIPVKRKPIGPQRASAQILSGNRVCENHAI